jgi:hypothetical protein
MAVHYIVLSCFEVQGESCRGKGAVARRYEQCNPASVVNGMSKEEKVKGNERSRK